MTKKGNIRRES